MSTPHETVVSSVEAREDGSLTLRLTMQEGVASAFSENDMLLLDLEPEVRRERRRRSEPGSCRSAPGSCRTQSLRRRQAAASDKQRRASGAVCRFIPRAAPPSTFSMGVR